MSMELAYTAFTSIKSFLERLACLGQPNLDVLNSRPDYIRVALRNFGGDFLPSQSGVDGLYGFIADELLPQCHLSTDSYQLKEETSSLIIMRIHGRTIRFFMLDHKDESKDGSGDAYNDLHITFDLEPNEYSAFLDMINRG